jgi:hypothetical protein
MFSLRICRLALSLSALLCTSVSAQRKPLFTSPLPTGVRLDPAGEAVDLGSLPINLVLTPEKDRAVVVLSGWREQGVQVVDLKTRKVTQTLLQDGAFYGAALVVVGAGVSGPRFEITGPAINKAACDVGFKYFGFFGSHRKAPFISRF